MKQEPEEEDNCYLDEMVMPTTTTAGVTSDSSRVRSHSKSLRAMANPSAVWVHFDLCVNDPLRAQCRICGSIVVRGGANPRQCGTTNLHRHLRVHHGGRLIGRQYHVTTSELNSQGASSNASKSFRLNQSMARQKPKPPKQQQQQHKQKTVVLKTISPVNMSQRLTSEPSKRHESPTRVVPPPIPQSQQEVCLRWNSYHSNMQTSFPSLLDTEQFVDVTLACEGRSIKCHKMILSSCSEYLAILLRENPCSHPIILMNNLKFWQVEALVNFMYRGEVNVSHDKLPELLNAAEALQVKGLAEPSLSSQNQKPPGLIPKPTPPPPKINQTKEIKCNKIQSILMKKQPIKKNESSFEARKFPKIRLKRSSMLKTPSTIIKVEPLDIPLNPNEIYIDHHSYGGGDTSRNYNNYLNAAAAATSHHGNIEFPDENIQYDELPGPPDVAVNDDVGNNEFVPTDYLEQEQDNEGNFYCQDEKIIEEEEEEEGDDDDDDDISVDRVIYQNKDLT